VRTGSVNQDMPVVQSSAAMPAAAPPPMAQQTSRAASQVAFETIPSRHTNNLSEKFSNLSKNVGQDSARSLLISSLAFFMLFLILAATKLIADHQRYKETETSSYQSEVISKANNAKRAIDSQIAWMDTALSTNGSPQQIINFVRAGGQTASAALIDASGMIMAATDSSGKELAKISRRNFAKGGIQISSYIAADGSGVVTPVITRRIGDSYLVVAMKPGSLIGSLDTSLAVIQNGGRVIDGPRSLGASGPQAFYSINAKKLSAVTSSTSENQISSHTIGDSKVWLNSARHGLFGLYCAT